MIVNSVISAQEISIGYFKSRNKQENSLYKNISFELYKGELVCLLGANGAGKSTLLRTISMFQPPLDGNIVINNKNISSYSETELAQLIGVVLTDQTSAGGLLVRELVELGRYPYTGFWGQMTDNDKKIVDKVMLSTGISHKADSYIAELSDGERQKAMIAKALAQECPIILLDEPTAFLDIESRIEIMELLHHLAMDEKKTILLSTHDVDLALLLADRLWLLSKDFGLKTGVTEDMILSGALDHFFKSENIRFNKNSGSFLPYRSSHKKVFVEADDLLHYWTKNMLERLGYSVTDNLNYALFSLIVLSPNSIKAKVDEITIEFNNFEELNNWLLSKNK